MRQVGQRLIKLSIRKADWIPIEEDLQVDQDVVLRVEGQVMERIESSTNSDEVDVIYVVKGLFAEREE